MTVQRAPRRELFAWAMYDFANSGYTTVVLTAVFNAYFVGVVAGAGSLAPGAGTLLWSLALGVANALILVSAPVLGAIADFGAVKKRLLAASTVGCVAFTAALAWVGPGDVWLAVVLVIVASVMFGTGENLIAAFLPEIAPPKDMGRISGYGWSLGYIGGLLVLGSCLAYVSWAQARGHGAGEFVPVTMLITAGAFALAAIPTFVWLRERAVPQRWPAGKRDGPFGYARIGFARLMQTLRRAAHFRDLFRFLIALVLYGSGVNTVVILAAIYAQEVMGFDTQGTITLILLVNVTAALGAFAFGHLQDRLESKLTLALTLGVWIVAVVIAYFAETRFAFWIAANLVGVALGSSQSAGRGLIGLFCPRGRAAEFFGLWGLAMKLAAILGPLCYGLIAYLSAGNHRLALLSTLLFFVAGLVMLAFVDEDRGRRAAVDGGARAA